MKVENLSGLWHISHWLSKRVIPLIKDDEERNRLGKERKFLEQYIEILRKKHSGVKVKLVDLYFQIDYLIKYSDYPEYKDKINIHKSRRFQSSSIKIDEDLMILEIIVDNILSNAFIRGEAKKLDIYLSNKGNNIELLFEDNGCGMDNVSEMLKPFKSSASAGLGMGLTIIKDLSNICGWYMDIKSEKNKGTKISFILRTY